jgi:hypothetical protein
MTISTAPILFGLVVLAFFLSDALKPKRPIRLRHIWIDPGRVSVVASFDAGNKVGVTLDSGVTYEFPCKQGETADQLRDSIGQALRKRRDLKG